MTASVPAVSLHAESRPDRVKRVVPHLGGVPETMLWTLYDRACETQRPNGVLVDPDSVRICDAIDYDYKGHFGHPSGAFAARAAAIDDLLRHWLERHPDGLIVSLGEGLEAQAHRVDNGRMRWLSVDLPVAIELREHFLPPTRRFSHVASNALERDWMDRVVPSSEIFIVAQGLFMYLKPEAVRQLFAEIAKRFPAAEMAFDVIPRWFSWLTLWGLVQTPRYRLPPMPWGIDRNEIEPGLRSWTSSITSVTVLDYRTPHGWPKAVEDFYRSLPVPHHELPCIVHATMGST